MLEREKVKLEILLLSLKCQLSTFLLLEPELEVFSWSSLWVPGYLGPRTGDPGGKNGKLTTSLVVLKILVFLLNLSSTIYLKALKELLHAFCLNFTATVNRRDRVECGDSVLPETRTLSLNSVSGELKLPTGTQLNWIKDTIVLPMKLLSRKMKLNITF